MKQTFFISAITLLLGMGQCAMADGDIAAGKAKAVTCAGCHGPDGNGTDNPAWPKLASQHPAYIVKQLRDFKARETRKDPIMSDQAAQLSEQDMLDLAAYFSRQKIKIGTADDNLAEHGGNVYRTRITTDSGNTINACIDCHGRVGAGKKNKNYPRLAGQNAAYIAKALRDFRSGRRSNDNGKVMRMIASHLSDDDIDAVASYIQGMGNYSRFVWPVYIIALLIMVANLVSPSRQEKQIIRNLKRKQRRESRGMQ